MTTTVSNANEGKGIFVDGWHKTPNAMIDLILGASISPSAAWIVMTVIRYTNGMGGRKSAAIPTETFKRVLGTNRVKTVYKIVDEAVSSGLITAIKKRGCVSIYSINEDCDLWRKATVVAESATSEVKSNDNTPVSESDSSGGKCHMSSGGKCHTVVAESATPVVAESATLIKKEESIKETSKEQNESNLFDKTYEVIKNHLKVAGIIPVNKPVIDECLKPDVYTFVAWFNEKGISDNQLARQAVQWFRKKEPDELKSYYTPANDMNGRYFNPDDYPKTIPMTDEEAAAIKAQYADLMRELRF